MTHRSDDKASALATLTGSTGHVDDLEMEWLLSAVTTPVSAQVNDLWVELFIQQGGTFTEFNDSANEFLGDLGYTGALPDKWSQYWAAGGGGIGPVGPWEYATIAAAESSGDPWVDGDDVQITGGALFLYKSAMAVSGYSGLIHKEPYGSGLGTLSATTVHGSEAADSDPDTWTGWIDGSTGVKTTDYDFDTATSLSRIRDLTVAGKALLNTTKTAGSSDTESFRIVDDVSGVSTSPGAQTFLQTIQLFAYKDGVDINWINLMGSADAASLNWRVNHTDASTFADTSKTRSTAKRAFAYIKAGRWAVWFDSDSTPAATGTVPRETTDTGSFSFTYTQVGSTAASSGTSTMLLGTDVFGIMTMV